MEPWKVTLTDSALSDLDEILEATLMEFGTVQFQRYTEQIQVAIRELEAKGADAPLLKSRDDIHPGMHSYPLARTGKGSPHHFYLQLDCKAGRNAVVILRVLHERMDPAKLL